MSGKMKIKVYLVAVVVAVTTGLSFLAAKTALVYGSPLEALMYRFAIGFIFALIIVGIRYGKNFKKGKSWKPLLIPALLYSGGFFGFQFFGLIYASSIEAGIIMAAQPAITMIIAEFAIKEKPSAAQRICVVMAILSAALISVYGNSAVDTVDIRGIILIALSALSMAANVVYIRWIRNDYTPTEVSFVSCALGCVIYTAINLVYAAAKGTLAHTAALITEPSFMLAAIYLGVCCTMLTTLLNSYMMRYLEAVKTSVFGCAGTIITLIAGYFFLNEKISTLQIISSVVILLSIIGTNALGRKPENKEINQAQIVNRDNDINLNENNMN